MICRRRRPRSSTRPNGSVSQSRTSGAPRVCGLALNVRRIGNKRIAQPRAANPELTPTRLTPVGCSGVFGGALQVHGVRRPRAMVPSTVLIPVQSPNAPATIATPGPAVAPRRMAVAAAQPAPAAMAPTARPGDTRAGLGARYPVP